MGYKILVVDDEPTFRKVMQRLLILDGHKVTLAGDGMEGIKALQKNEFDAVLTDINMPVMNGWEMLEFMVDNFPDIPTAVITGLPNTDDAPPKAISFPKRIMKKPVKIDEIRDLIQFMLV